MCIKSILCRIRKRKVRGVWIGVSCASWTRARRAPVESSMPSPLRGDSPDTIWGLPDLSLKDQARVEGGNATLRFTIRVFKACLKAGVPCFVENPLTSRIWIAPPMQLLQKSLRRDGQGGSIVWDHCAFGSSSKNATKVLYCHCDVNSLAKRCHSKAGLCEFTRDRHVVLSGFSGGSFKTALASAYPLKFYKDFAKLFK